jgi:hypothetical protein
VWSTDKITRIIEVMPLPVYYHNYFIYVSSIFTIKLFMSGTARISTKIHLLVIVPVFHFNLLARVSAKNCLPTQYGLTSQPHS